MKKILIPSALVLTLCLCLAVGYAAAGDPLVSLSYLEGIFSRSLEESVDSRMDTADEEIRGSVQKQLDVMEGNLLAAAGQTFAASQQETTLKSGDVLSGPTGLVVLAYTGQVRVSYSEGTVVDASDGSEIASGQLLTFRHRYIVAEGTFASFTVESVTAVVSYQGPYALSLSDETPDYYRMARALRSLHLLEGTEIGIGEGFSLDSVPNRGQGLVMFIRLLGEEEAAFAANADHPFTDVASWLSPYVGWAYQQGYTDGVSATSFSPRTPISVTQYEEFLLRALGYSVIGAHSQSTSLSRAMECGALTQEDVDLLTQGKFCRAQMAYISYHSLDVTISGSRQTLAQRLMSAGVFTAAELSEARELVDSPLLP